MNLAKRVQESVCRSLSVEGGNVSRRELQQRGWSPQLLKRLFKKKEEIPLGEVEQGLSLLWASHAPVDSLLGLFDRTCEVHKHRNAYGYWIVDSLYPLGAWKYVTFNQVRYLATDVRDLMYEMGVRRGDRVSIISRNCAEWVAICVAAFSLRATVVPLHESQHEEDWLAAISDSRSKVVFVGNEDLYEKVKGMKERSKTDVEEIICIDGVTGFLRHMDYAFTHRLKKIRDVRNRVFSPVERCEPDDVAFLLYQHASDGTLRPLPLSHAQAVCSVLERSLSCSFSRSEVSMSFLSWSEPAGLVLELFCMMESGGAIAMSEGRTKFRYNCQEVKPSVMFTRYELMWLSCGDGVGDVDD